MRSGGEPTSVLWGDTAVVSSHSPPLSSSASSNSSSASPSSSAQEATMNCFEGLPHHHHHHLASIHHPHHHPPPPPPPPHVIHLLPSPHAAATPPAMPGRTAADGGGEDAGEASPAPRQVTEGQQTPPNDEDAASSAVDKEEEEGGLSSPADEASSPHPGGAPGGHPGSVRVKQELAEGEDDVKDDSGISPGSGGGAEREVDDDPHLEGSPDSSRGGDRGGQNEDGARSPYSEGCYSEGCEDADLRRLQYSESAGGGHPYSEGDAGGQRPDASDEDEAGGDVNKPRITSQGKFKTFRCKQCDFVALNKLEFWAHSRMHIRAERLLTCPRCPFVTEYKHHLEYHLRNHFGSKPFKCPHCPYTCVNKSMLNSHLKSHSSVYQYRCADCGYATKYCHSLKLHLRKYSHQPAMVLHPDGSPNPLPVIDVYGTRRGPKTGSKKTTQQPLHSQEGAAPASPPSSTPPVSVPATIGSAVTAPHSGTTTTSSSGLPFQTMLVYPSSPSPSYTNGAGGYYGPASTMPPSSTYSTPQTSRPILPRVLQPRTEAEDQWSAGREAPEHPDGQAKKAGPSIASNRPVKCTLCEFASTSREAFAEHMMVHAANGDVGNRESGSEAGLAKSLSINPHHPHHHHHHQQQQSLLMANGFNPAQNTDVRIKEYLAQMLTAVVPQIGAFRGQVPPQLQAHWHAHVQQQMQQHQQHFQQTSNGGILPQQNTIRHPTSPQPIQRPWLNQDAQTQLPKPTESPSATMVVEEEDGERDEAMTSGGEEGRECRRLPNGGVPLDLTKESTPRQQLEHQHLVEERQKGGVPAVGGSSRRKGRAFKLERIARNLQRGEEEVDGGSSGDEEEERHSHHSDNEDESSVDSSSKRKRVTVASDEPKVTKTMKSKEDKEDYHCPYCDIAFRDVVLYTMHMGYHGYQDPFKCNMCGQETNDKVSFFLHVARSSHS